MPTVDHAKLKKFLDEDLYNSFRWLFEGAIAWEVGRAGGEKTRHQGLLGMFTTMVQARALYEFFYTTSRSKPDDARLKHFSDWKPSQSQPYVQYMGHQKAANKRIFHLVYERATHAGGTEEHADRLEDKVMVVARDLSELCKQFVTHSKPEFRESVRGALSKAIVEAQKASDEYGVANPFAS